MTAFGDDYVTRRELKAELRLAKTEMAFYGWIVVELLVLVLVGLMLYLRK